MPHEVESMFYAGQVPWHGIGNHVPSEVTSSEALKLSGLDWTVALSPVFSRRDSWPDVHQVSEIQDCMAVIRQSDGRALGVVGSRYHPIQNEFAFKFMDELCRGGQAVYHAAGSLFGGRKVWVLAKLPGVIRVGLDDVTEKFLLLTNSFDGSTALRLMWTPIRVVCANTLRLALHRGAAEGVSIRHTASAEHRVEVARRALGFTAAYYDRFEREAQVLAAAKYTDGMLDKLVHALFPAKDGHESTRRTKARSAVSELFVTGRGHEYISGTAWAALNAVAEYADHHRSPRGADGRARAEARLSSAWFGTGAQLEQLAHETIVRQLAAA